MSCHTALSPWPSFKIGSLSSPNHDSLKCGFLPRSTDVVLRGGRKLRVRRLLAMSCKFCSLPPSNNLWSSGSILWLIFVRPFKYKSLSFHFSHPDPFPPSITNTSFTPGMYDGCEHTPKLLHCSHTVCLECLDRIVATFARDTGQFR